MRVRMVRCLGYEVEPPGDPIALEAWCVSGRSGRPVQTHVGDEGEVLWVNDEDGTVVVAFDDGDERVLYPGEVEFTHIAQ